MTGEVSCLKPYEWIETPWSIAGSYGQVQLSDRHVVCVDYGAKRNILPSLGVALRAFRHSWPTGGRRCRNSRGAAWAHNRTRPSRPIRVGRRARPTFPKGSGSSCSRSRTAAPHKTYRQRRPNCAAALQWSRWNEDCSPRALRKSTLSRLLRCTPHFRDGSFASKVTEAVRPCTSATPPKADVNSPPWLPLLSAKSGLMQRSKTTLSLDHVVGKGKHVLREFNPERLCGLEVDYEFKLG
jgi:hypothetical protein